MHVRAITWILLLCACSPQARKWLEGHPATPAQRDGAVLRGLDFIYETARSPAAFRQHSSDYLWCFLGVARTSPESLVKARARAYLLDLAVRWREQLAIIPTNSDPDALVELAMSTAIAREAGIPVAQFDRDLRRALAELEKPFLSFDPTRGPPSRVLNILEGPEACEARGVAGDDCEIFSEWITDYDSWYDGLITTYFGDLYGYPLGGRFDDLMGWRAQLYPYRSEARIGEDAYHDQLFFATHMVYTHSDYGSRQLDPDTLPNEYRFLREHFLEVLAGGDVETFGEFIDGLRIFGADPNREPKMAEGMIAILESQNEDGSWGDTSAEDVYDRYHATWTAIDAIRAYAWE